jgi:hypothetical protein
MYKNTASYTDEVYNKSTNNDAICHILLLLAVIVSTIDY